MTKALARIVVYKPAIHRLNGVKITGYEYIEKDWKPLVFRSKLNNLVNRMAIEAGKLAYENKEDKSYVYVYIEAPGLVVFEGEGEVANVDTIFYPRITRLYKIVFLRKNGDKLEPIKEVNVDNEIYIYDGTIELDEEIEYDAILIQTEHGPRILLKEELKIPVQVKIMEKTKKRRKRRKTTKRKVKKTKKKTGKKKTKRKRRKKKKKR